MTTFLIEILQLPNFGHMTTSIDQINIKPNNLRIGGHFHN